MEIELFEIIKSVNRLSDNIIGVSKKVDILIDVLSQTSTRELSNQYVSEDTAAGIIRRCPRTLLKFRKTGELPFLRVGKKVLYKTSDLQAFIERNYNKE